MKKIKTIKQDAKNFFEKHKRKIYIGTGVGIALFSALFALKYQDDHIHSADEAFTDIEPDEVLDNLIQIEVTNGQTKAPHKVSAHIRKLGENMHSSPEKRAEAMALGIVLDDSHTYVGEYHTGINFENAV